MPPKRGARRKTSRSKSGSSISRLELRRDRAPQIGEFGCAFKQLFASHCVIQESSGCTMRNAFSRTSSARVSACRSISFASFDRSGSGLSRNTPAAFTLICESPCLSDSSKRGRQRSLWAKSTFATCRPRTSLSRRPSCRPAKLLAVSDELGKFVRSFRAGHQK